MDRRELMVVVSMSLMESANVSVSDDDATYHLDSNNIKEFVDSLNDRLSTNFFDRGELVGFGNFLFSNSREFNVPRVFEVDIERWSMVNDSSVNSLDK